MNRKPLDMVLNGYGRVAVLFSGGRDSEVLLRTAAEVLGRDAVISLTADSPLLAEFYRSHIIGVCSELGLEPLFFDIWDSLDGLFRINDAKRCYFCKKTIFATLAREAGLRDFEAVADGTTLDDLGEERPGLAAAEEEGIRHPFVEAGFGSSEVLRLAGGSGSLEGGLPSDSCLATRLPEGSMITRESLGLVEELEAPVRPMARGRFRIKVKPGLALVEFEEPDREAVLSNLEELERVASEAGLRVEISSTGN